MKLTLNNQILAQKKALILYILDKISKPISSNSLLQILTSIDNINYFYFQQFLLDLLENKYIIKYQKNGEDLYELTNEGKQALNLVKDIIPGITKFKVDNSFKKELGKIQNQISISSEFIPHSENNYTVSCKILEDTQILFELKIFAGSIDQAKAISDKWNNNAEELYPKILEILTK